MSEELSYEERMNHRFKNNAPGLNTRYYCAECHERLPASGEVTRKLPGNVIFMQDVYFPCSKHPASGFYIMFVNDNY
ncbi:MAG: hypothetical protein ACFFD4_08015 [Candidatus Odinarchaeota archaeon]